MLAHDLISRFAQLDVALEVGEAGLGSSTLLMSFCAVAVLDAVVLILVSEDGVFQLCCE